MKLQDVPIHRFYPKQGKGVLTAKGHEFVKEVGTQTIREVVYDVLCGENIRRSTETLTRKRIASANGSLLVMFLRGCNNIDSFFERLPELTSHSLQKKLKKEDKWILEWLLGLTDKAFQNILRDDPRKLKSYTEDFEEAIKEASKNLEKKFGKLKCKLELSKTKYKELSWEDMVLIFTAIGSQTLTIRGSEKSTYGKLFERLVLGSLLHILDFKLVSKETNKELNKIFWLASREDKRESDATLIYKPGKGIRFDIGFIGRGNPEISLDKVSRFEREFEYGRKTHYMGTFIIVDRVGKNSRIYDMAKRIDGTIIQMSMSIWPKIVAKKLNDILGYKHEILEIPDDELPVYIQRKLKTAPIEDFIRLSNT